MKFIPYQPSQDPQQPVQDHPGSTRRQWERKYAGKVNIRQNRRQLAKAMRNLRNTIKPGETIKLIDDRYHFIRLTVIRRLQWQLDLTGRYVTRPGRSTLG